MPGSTDEDYVEPHFSTKTRFFRTAPFDTRFPNTNQERWVETDQLNYYLTIINLGVETLC